MSHFSPPGMKYNRSSLLSLENNYRHTNGGAKTLTIKKLKSVYMIYRTFFRILIHFRLHALLVISNELVTDKKERYDEILARMQTNCGYHDGIIQHNKQLQENKKGRKNALTTSGVYECHSGCACQNKWCNNRVVQNGMNIPLVVYRTEKSGWGIRTIVDLKAGYYLGSGFTNMIKIEISIKIFISCSQKVLSFLYSFQTNQRRLFR